MKRMFQRRLTLILSIGMLCSFLIGFFLQVGMTRRDADTASAWLFWQVQQILTENQVETRQTKEDFQDQCLSRARAAAYIIQNSSIDLADYKELARIAALLQVDELHIFNTNGTIVAGSEPKYFGYNFNSGEQMQFFMPMMKDHSLELCQDVTPNTAEGKLMQYAAVWQENDAGIVQIGVTPARVLEAQKKNELSYIFSLLTESGQTDLCAADPETYEILGTTEDALSGQSLIDLGFSKAQLDAVTDQLQNAPEVSGLEEHDINTASLPRVRVNGVRCYCIFASINGLLVGRFCEASALFAPAYHSMLLFAALMLAIFLLMQLSISRYIDKVILRGIDIINGKLRNIADGELDETVNVDTTPEFAQLSWYINHMVKSILSTTAKLSFVLSAVQLPIAVYEYSDRKNQVNFTSKLPEILGLSKQEANRLLHDRRLFEEKLNLLRAQPVDENIFRTPDGRFVKMETYTSGVSISGILVDVTADIAEKRRLEHERDVDLLTNLLNRRGFYERLDLLFACPEQLKHAALLMMDTDDLKYVNDQFGHAAGDIYLRNMANILEAGVGPEKITARLSGDEFALFIYGCDTQEQLRHCVAQLEAQQGPLDAASDPRTVRFSMGAAICPEDAMDYHVLMRLADQRMYENKRQRKTKCVSKESTP